MKHSPLNEEKTRREATPNATRMSVSDKEIRCELPYRLAFEDLAYIGIVLFETWHVRAHYHDHFELCYVDEGKGWFIVDELLYEVSKGDLFLTKPGESHHGAASGDCPFRLYYFGFHLEQMRSLEIGYYNIGSQRVAHDREGLVKRNCDAIFEEIRQNRAYSKQMVQGLFMQTLVSVLRHYENRIDASAKDPLTLPDPIKQVLIRLHTETSCRHDMDELAGTVNFSRSHLDREFKRYMGVSLGKYIRSLGIDRAKHCLRDTSESITSIAEKLGFESIHKFSLFFKRHTGMSPHDYRKRLLSPHPPSPDDEKV